MLARYFECVKVIIDLIICLRSKLAGDEYKCCCVEGCGHDTRNSEQAGGVTPGLEARVVHSDHTVLCPALHLLGVLPFPLPHPSQSWCLASPLPLCSHVPGIPPKPFPSGLLEKCSVRRTPWPTCWCDAWRICPFYRWQGHLGHTSPCRVRTQCS